MKLDAFLSVAPEIIAEFGRDTVLENASNQEDFPLERDDLDWWAELFAFILLQQANVLVAEGKQEEAEALLQKYLYRNSSPAPDEAPATVDETS